MTMLPPSKKPRLNPEHTIAHLCRLYKAPSDVSFRQFCKKNKLARANLAKIWKASGLDKMKQNGESVDVAMNTLRLHLNERNDRLKASLDSLHEKNECMTEDESNLVMNIAKLLGHMGMGIDTQVCLDIVNAVLRVRCQVKEFKMVTKSVVQRMLRNNRETIQLVHGNTMIQTESGKLIRK